MAVKTGEVATPEELVCAVTVAPPPANAPLAPEPGAVKVTVTFETGLPPESFTVTTSGVLKAVRTCAFWPLPDVVVMLAGAPAVFVKAKAACAATPVTEAFTG